VRRFLVIAFLAFAFAPSAFAADVYVTNNSSLPDAAVADALPAYQQALDQDFAPVWREAQGSRLIFGEPPEGAWRIDIADVTECFYCAGYHDVKGGVPFAVVLADEDWQITFTHELWELLVNPNVDRSATVKGKLSKRKRVIRKYALETADPVEGDQFAYVRQSASGKPVHISDFVAPSWFRRGSTGPWDFARKTKRPLQILEDGYQLYFHDGGWDAIWAGDDARADGLAKAGQWNGRRPAAARQPA
jgi:hypothetical protein